LRWQPSEELQNVAGEIERALDRFRSEPPPLELGTKRFEWGRRTCIMGILNVTPDSFSEFGLVRAGDTPETLAARALERARQFVDDGADVLDVGGESTRPGATPVDGETEMARVLPVVRELAANLAVPVSIDTLKPAVADAALAAGACMVNHVGGSGANNDMARVAASHRAALVIMHNLKLDPAEPDVLRAVIQELSARIERALNAGVPASRVVVDPGLGFGKSAEQNLELLNRLGELRACGCAIMIGPSRKGFISKATGVRFDEREEGTAAAVAVGILRGANLVRVHAVRSMARVARMTEAIRWSDVPKIHTGQ
jgi:dihydropteroate synthase